MFVIGQTEACDESHACDITESPLHHTKYFQMMQDSLFVIDRPEACDESHACDIITSPTAPINKPPVVSRFALQFPMVTR
ncbi:hypothetical protein GDO81_029544 [Engystomops pustulosus]|uniref:Uncharacterized protein n=1 Tax=Engystomops pustulosus TaxID=76066 RepID=A0AAV6Z4I1_ENGPU|nr:hypothetical protein GDO81_029544 [Engystomops pustulosus]